MTDSRNELSPKLTMGIPETICSLCSRGKEELQFGALFALSDSEVYQLTYNIIWLTDSFLLCSKCCQELALVGKLLYQWRGKISVSLSSGVDVASKREVEDEETLGGKFDYLYCGDKEDDLFHDDDGGNGNEEEARLEEQNEQKHTHGRKVGQKRLYEDAVAEEGEEPVNSTEILDRRLRSNERKIEGEKRLKENDSSSPTESKDKRVSEENIGFVAEPDDVTAGVTLSNAEQTNPRLSDPDFECSEESDFSDWETDRRKPSRKILKKQLDLLNKSDEKPTQSSNFAPKLIGKRGRKKKPPTPEQSELGPKLIGKRGRKRTKPPKPNYSDLDPTCPICGKIYTLKAYLVAHIARHSLRHICDTCGKTFTTQTKLRLHLLSHSGERPHKCDLCEKSYKKLQSLRIHQAVAHGGVKKHLCSYCPSRFHSKIDRIFHERTHTKEKPYQCRHCPKSFSRPARRKDHELTHGHREKKCPCRICGKCFFNVDTRNGHERVFHNPPTKPCPFRCGKMFKKIQDAKNHAKTIHGDADGTTS